MIPVSMSANAVGPTRWVAADYHIAPFQLSIGVIAAGTINYSVQYTYDDVAVASPAPTPLNDAVLVNATATGDTTFNNPITGWRVLVNSVSGGSVTIRGIQAGMP